jgi:hypothetical protein
MKPVGDAVHAQVGREALPIHHTQEVDLPVPQLVRVPLVIELDRHPMIRHVVLRVKTVTRLVWIVKLGLPHSPGECLSNLRIIRV